MTGIKRISNWLAKEAWEVCVRWTIGTSALLRSQKGQGTAEYAILVGVLVVIAISAIVIFGEKLQGLWNVIAEGVSQL